LEELRLEAELTEDVLAAIVGSQLYHAIGFTGPGLLIGVDLLKILLPCLINLGFEHCAFICGLREHPVVGVARLYLPDCDHPGVALFLAKNFQ
jgi:hypothetical protein